MKEPGKAGVAAFGFLSLKVACGGIDNCPNIVVDDCNYDWEGIEHVASAVGGCIFIAGFGTPAFADDVSGDISCCRGRDALDGKSSSKNDCTQRGHTLVVLLVEIEAIATGESALISVSWRHPLHDCSSRTGMQPAGKEFKLDRLRAIDGVNCCSVVLRRSN